MLDVAHGLYLYYVELYPQMIMHRFGCVFNLKQNLTDWKGQKENFPIAGPARFEQSE